jgi:GT2 family glycosyltransferase
MSGGARQASSVGNSRPFFILGWGRSGTGLSTPSLSRGSTAADREPFPDDVAVGIVSHNGLTKLPRSLEALARCGCPAERITIADVASDDGTGEWLRRTWPGVEIVRLPENRGPNPARNVLLEHGGAPFLLLMDDDVESRPDTVGALYRTIRDDPSIAVACPIVVYGDRPDIVNYACGPLHYLVEAIDPYQGRSLSELPPGRREAIIMTGCALLIRRRALHKALMFDERFFFGRDDGDFAYRLAVAGRRSVVVGDAVVLHHTRARGSKMFRHQLANSWHMMLKNYQLSTMLVIAPMMALHILVELLAVAKQGQIRAFGAAIRDLAARLPALAEDRAAIAAIRCRFDIELLSGEPFIVPWQLVAGRVVRRLVFAYQRVLRAYWALAQIILRACGQRPRLERDGARRSEADGNLTHKTSRDHEHRGTRDLD